MKNITLAKHIYISKNINKNLLIIAKNFAKYPNYLI